jgi:hypothetical protein
MLSIEQLSKGSYVLLGLLRMGQDCGIIQYLADVYDASQERGGVMMASSNLTLSNVKYSRCARAYFLNCADSTTNDVTENSGQKKAKRPRREKQWSMATLKDFGDGK